MGWGNLLGDFAKEFAKGYVQERGVKGTLEDIKDIGSAASGFFGGLSSKKADDAEWNELFSSVGKLIEQGEYIESLNTIDNFYTEYSDGTGDVTYFYLRALTLVEYLESQVGHEDFNEIFDALVEAIKEGKSFKDKDLNDDFNEFEERCRSAADNNAELVAWFELRDKCTKLCQNADFNKAEMLIEDWYKRYDNDLFHPYMLALINIERHKYDLSSGKLPAHEEIEGTESLISAVARYENSSESCKELNDALDEVKIRMSSLKPASATNAITDKSDGSSLTDNEKEYLDEVKACLEDDGEITARERRLLDKLCHSLGISDARAAELEAIALGKSELTASEKEYLDEYKACLEEDGVISDRERRLLDRLAKSLDIAPERVREIEASQKH